MINGPTIPLHTMRGTRYSRVLNYPETNDSQLGDRLNELAGTGITAIRFRGPSKIDGIEVLGKGCVGLVVQAILEGKVVALKVRRLDADRKSMYEEARLLRLANSVNVGPHLVASTKNFLIMQLFHGVPLYRWAKSFGRRKELVKYVLLTLLNECFKLDSIGLDHGELSHAPKNVLVGHTGAACIVDFESASMVRRVANVTSLLQYFLFGSVSNAFQTASLLPARRRILRALSQYKHEASVESYRSLLQTLQLTDEPP